MGWELFLACMFIGLGIGMLAGRPDVGIILGMGVGFLLSSVDIKRFKHPTRVFEWHFRSTIDISFPLLAIGLILVLYGLDMLGVIKLPVNIFQLFCGVILIVIGIGFVLMAIRAREYW